MDGDKLTLFLYILMRDHLPTGVVAGIVKDFVEKVEDLDLVYTNVHLEAYARELAWRIRRRKTHLEEVQGQ